MLNRLRQRAADDSGFTLIELLVVILIIGILAAIAIPSLLSQKEKAYAASAKQLASSAQTAAETIGTDHEGEYSNVSPEELNKYEKTIPTSKAAAHGGAWIAEAVSIESGAGYYVVVQSAGKLAAFFEIRRNGAGEVIRTCGTSNSSGTLSGKSSASGCATESW